MYHGPSLYPFCNQQDEAGPHLVFFHAFSYKVHGISLCFCSGKCKEEKYVILNTLTITMTNCLSTNNIK